MPDNLFPRRILQQNHKCQLMLVRRIPDRLAAAIYCGPPTLIKGNLVQEYLIVAPDFSLLAQASSLPLAFQKLFMVQDSLIPVPKLKRYPRRQTGELKLEAEPA